MHSIRKTHWGDRDSGGNTRVMSRPGYDLKLPGDTEDSMKINQIERLRWGIKRTSAGRSELKYSTQAGNNDFIKEIRT